MFLKRSSVRLNVVANRKELGEHHLPFVVGHPKFANACSPKRPSASRDRIATKSPAAILRRNGHVGYPGNTAFRRFHMARDCCASWVHARTGARRRRARLCGDAVPPQNHAQMRRSKAGAGRAGRNTYRFGLRMVFSVSVFAILYKTSVSCARALRSSQPVRPRHQNLRVTVFRST